MLFSASAESVGEYLIHNSALYPVGSRHILVKNGKLEQLSVIKNAEPCSATLYISPVAVYRQREIIVVQTFMQGVEITGKHVAFCGRIGNVKRYEAFLFARTEHYKSRVADVPFLRKTQGECAGLILSYCSEGAFIV